MRKLPYVVVYVDRDLTDVGLTGYLNMQWKDGWEYVAHLPGPSSYPKQGLLMKKRDLPEPFKVFNALMTLYKSKNLTTHELFASFTSLLSEDPSDLPEVRAWLGEGETRDKFEEWLRGLLRDRPVIQMSSGLPITLSEELLAALAKDEKEKK